MHMEASRGPVIVHIEDHIFSYMKFIRVDARSGKREVLGSLHSILERHALLRDSDHVSANRHNGAVAASHRHLRSIIETAADRNTKSKYDKRKHREDRKPAPPRRLRLRDSARPEAEDQ